ncbi:MAG: hypothetical protein J6P21_01260 [Clostridia bacterium]|nr:hypothetical protein [Clostridia bacterium]
MPKKIKTKLALILAIGLSTTPVLAMEPIIEKQNDKKFSSLKSNLTDERFLKHIEGLDNCSTLLPIAGKKTLLNFILVGCYAISRVLYTLGGGWNAEDDGASKLAKTIGLAKSILDFTRSHYSKSKPNTESTETYKFEVNGEIKESEAKIEARDERGNTILKNGSKFDMFKYIYDGFDCSGFVGWIVYNTLNTENDNGEGYVGSSTTRAEFFSKKGWGELKQITKEQIENGTYELYPGDIVSIQGHVYISLGKCNDGSVVLLHSSPPGVWIMGTTDKDGNKNSDAIKLAEKYGQKYPTAYKWLKEIEKKGVEREWKKYFEDPIENSIRDPNKKPVTRLVWYVDGEKGVLTDPEGIRKMSPEKVLGYIFGNESDILQKS